MHRVFEDPAPAAARLGLDSVRDALVLVSIAEDQVPRLVFANAAAQVLLEGSLDDASLAGEILAASKRSKDAAQTLTVQAHGWRQQVPCSVLEVPGHGRGRMLLAVFDHEDSSGCADALVKVRGMVHVCRLASSGGSIGSLLAAYLDAAVTVTAAEEAMLERIEGDVLICRASSSEARNRLGVRLAVSESLSGRAYRQREPLIIEDAAEDLRVRSCDVAAYGRFRSAVLVRVESAGRCYGVLAIRARQARAFRGVHAELLQFLAGFIATTVDDSRSSVTHDRQRLLIDALPALVSYIGTDKRYRDVNDAYLDWFGLRREEVVGQRVRDVLGEAAFALVEPHMDAALAGRTVSFETEVPYLRGRPRPVQADYIPHQLIDGEVRGFYVLVQDISDRRRAEIDYLTDLYNRRAFDARLDAACRDAAEHQRPLSLLLLDVDHFKRINDNHGHAGGDEVLRQMARQLKRTLSEEHAICRWGGEEFAVLCAGTDLRAARHTAETLRAGMAAATFDGIGPVTVSIGVGTLAAGERAGDFVMRVDRALFRAKDAGRDRVEFSEGPRPAPAR